jgi:hypothetical protein
MMNYDELYRIARDQQIERLKEADAERRIKAAHGPHASLLERLGKAYGALLSILA